MSVKITAAGAIPNVSERLGTVERPLSLPEPVPFVGKIPFHIHVDPSDLIDQGSKAGKIHFDEMIDGNLQEMFHCAYGRYYSVSEGVRMIDFVDSGPSTPQQQLGTCIPGNVQYFDRLPVRMDGQHHQSIGASLVSLACVYADQEQADRPIERRERFARSQDVCGRLL